MTIRDVIDNILLLRDNERSNYLDKLINKLTPMSQAEIMNAQLEHLVSIREIEADDVTKELIDSNWKRYKKEQAEAIIRCVNIETSSFGTLTRSYFKLPELNLDEEL